MDKDIWESMSPAMKQYFGLAKSLRDVIDELNQLFSDTKEDLDRIWKIRG